MNCPLSFVVMTGAVLVEPLIPPNTPQSVALSVLVITTGLHAITRFIRSRP